MDLREPLASLMSPVEAASLRVLSRSTAEFTGRQVAKLADTGTPAGIRKALLRLVTIGLVKFRSEPHASYYAANPDHILWPVVERGLLIRRQLEEQLIEIARTAATDQMTVAVFGSYPRGEAGPGSDIDFVVVFPDTLDEDRRDQVINSLTGQVAALTGNAASVYDTTPSDLRRLFAAGDPIVSSWIEDARTLTGPDLIGLIRR